MLSTKLTGVNPIPVPYIPSNIEDSEDSEDSEDRSDFSVFESSLSQTVEPGDLFDVGKTFSLTRAEIATKKQLPWFKIGRRSPYLLALFEDPYRIVQFFFGKEFWPSSTLEYLGPVYKLSFLNVFSKLHLHHPQNILVLSNFSTEAQPVIGKEPALLLNSTPEKRTLLKIATPPSDMEIDASQKGVWDDSACFLVNVVTELLMPVDEDTPSLKPDPLMSVADEALYDARDIASTVHVFYPQRCTEAVHASLSQENVEQGDIQLKTHILGKPSMPVPPHGLHENAFLHDAHDPACTVGAFEDNLLPKASSKSKSIQENPTLTNPSHQSSVPQKNNRAFHILRKKNQKNLTYSGPRRRGRICECSTHSPNTHARKPNKNSM